MFGYNVYNEREIPIFDGNMYIYIIFIIILYIYDPRSHSLGGVGVPHFVVNQPLPRQNGSGTESPSYKMVCL
jgi:hypothetical protein